MSKTSFPTCVPGAVSGALASTNLRAFCRTLAVALLALGWPAQAPGAATAPEAQPEAKAAQPAPAAQVKLLEAGAKPRKALRLHPKAGDKQSLDLTIKWTMDVPLGEMGNQVMKMPPMKISADVTVKSVAPGGDIAYDLVITDSGLGEEPDAMPQAVEALKASMTGLKGRTGKGVMSDRGVSKALDMDVPPDADPQMRQTVEQMTEAFCRMAVKLPEETVGRGAKWEYKDRLKSQGMTRDEASSYEVVSIEGERLTAKSTSADSAPKQKIQNPAMQGMEMELNSLSGTSHGTVLTDLGRLFPSKATGDAHTELSMAMDMGVQKNSMTMKIDATITLESK